MFPLLLLRLLLLQLLVAAIVLIIVVDCCVVRLEVGESRSSPLPLYIGCRGLHLLLSTPIEHLRSKQIEHLSFIKMLLFVIFCHTLIGTGSYVRSVWSLVTNAVKMAALMTGRTIQHTHPMKHPLHRHHPS